MIHTDACIARCILPKMYVSVGSTLPRLRKNKLIEKRKEDSVKHALDNVIFRANSVAVAVTRLQASAATVVTPPTPSSPMNESSFSNVIEPNQSILTLSGTKRRRLGRESSRPETPSGMIGVTNGRLSSLKV
jgi:hypothetical protein